MATRMLIDANHPEETRVVVVKGNRLEEFDYESTAKRQLKGNIYLAKVTRVEPSLQAAFVEYGGNRHGFLAFNEIHPDYYQIPIEDRQRLLAEVNAEAAAADRDEDEAAADPRSEGDDTAADEAGADDAKAEEIEDAGGDDFDDTAARLSHRELSRRYKIQEVIKRRQILLVQVVKEERGNKGAALTTYLSLAGRYCVLMPNTARGGGISRKINKPDARKKLKSIMRELDVPDGMGVIVRTAGMNRTKSEIKRDYEFLLRIWEETRERTLESAAPELVYEEASLIKRSIRDLYTKDIDDVLVEGEDGYRIAKDFMRQLMPSHAKRVQPYKDLIPLFHRYQIETQLTAMHEHSVQLPSGGYIVINPTEALVAIDINSGKATKERNIEETALKTNLEAAEEIARQVRLRDLAGLVVIDFIDMEEGGNNRAVERKLKDCLKTDRARIQLGKISAFGLLELSRQRLRPSFQEASGIACPHCGGTGVVRTTETMALQVLRGIEDEGIRQRAARIVAYVPTEVAFYVLNHKRSHLATIEARYGLTVLLEPDTALTPGDMRIERLEAKTDADGEPVAALTAPAPAEETAEDDDQPKRKRRRRRRRRKDETDGDEELQDAQSDAPTDTDDAETADGEDTETEADGEDGSQPKRRRRGRRGGRRRRRGPGEEGQEGTADDIVAEAAPGTGPQPDLAPAADAPVEHGAEPAPVTVKEIQIVDVTAHVTPPLAPPTPAPEPVQADPALAETAPVVEATADKAGSDPAPLDGATAEETPPVPDKPKRAGWWSRTLGGK